MKSRAFSIAGATSLVIVLVVLLLAGVARIPGMLGDAVGDFMSSANPFKEESTDRTGPSVLTSLQRLSEFKAASAYYETVVDLENDTNNVPDFISGERVLYVGKGNVDAVVDFSELDERRVTVSADKTSVAVALPAPQVGEPRLDLETSYIANLDSGLLNTFRGSDIEQEAQLKAVDQMTASAEGQADLIALAEESTTAMLNGLFTSLGYTDITVTFEASD